jgi:hypothetical protein
MNAFPILSILYLQFLLPPPAGWGDVVISEVMYDPEPAPGESLGEYLELYNRSGQPADPEGWTLTVGERKYTLHRDRDLLEPGGYFVVRDITLPNDGATLALYDREGNLVHAVRYREAFGGPDWKREGGWSLEAPDPDRVCRISDQWEWSTDLSGGTPGRLNSTDAERMDTDAPVFLYFGFTDSAAVILYFSEPVLPESVESGMVQIRPGNLTARRVSAVRPLSEQLSCTFSGDPSTLPGFRMSLPGICDCSGNRSAEGDICGGAVVTPRKGTVLISEIMYDPSWDRAEFIELYNPGPGFADLQDLSVDIVPDVPEMKQPLPLSGHSRILAPYSYVVFARDIRHLMDSYGLEISGQWVELPGMKSLPNSGGWICLADRAGNLVDVAAYNDTMHMALIGDPSGISLERVSWDSPGTGPGNWHSAASLEGYATPGRPNSQSFRESGGSDLLSAEPAVFSPNQDGYRDRLDITVSTLQQGSIIRLWITDLTGNPVRSLANNHIAGPVARYTWDGEDDQGRMTAEGIYVVHLRVYHPASGSRRQGKKAVGLVYP